MNWKVRIKNPVFWIQVIVIILLTALSYNSMQPADLTSWAGVWGLLLGIIENPYLIAVCLWAAWCAINDPTTAGLSDSALAKQYLTPRVDTTTLNNLIDSSAAAATVENDINSNGAKEPETPSADSDGTVDGSGSV